MHTFKKLDTVTITRTGEQGIVVSTYMHNLRLKIQVRTYRNGPALSYEAHQLEPYTVQSPDTIFYMDDLGVMWPYEVLDVTADGEVCKNPTVNAMRLEFLGHLVF